MADKQSRGLGDLTVKIDVDVSEALTGLKAVQREAKEATRALRELDAAQLDTREGSVIHALARHFGLTPQELSVATSDELAVMWRTYIRREHDASIQSVIDAIKLTDAEEAEIREIRGSVGGL